MAANTTMANKYIDSDLLDRCYLYTLDEKFTEGVQTSKALCELAKKFDVEVPVSNAIYQAVYTDTPAKEVFMNLMNRKLKEEEKYV